MAGIWVGADELMKVGDEIARVKGERLIRILWKGEKAYFPAYLPPLVELAAQEKPSVIILPYSLEMNDLAARLACVLNCPFISGCIGLKYVEAGSLEATRYIYGGAAVQVVRNETWPVIVSVAGGERIEVEGVETREVYPAPQTVVQVLSRREKEVSGRPITEAKVIVSVGRGLKSPDDLGIVRELAEAINGEVACTRPLASELHWLPESACIGLSGAQVEPELYLALGISGQVQHVVGVRGARIVVAVNRDEKAPIFGAADFGVVGDLYSFIPLFLEALKART